MREICLPSSLRRALLSGLSFFNACLSGHECDFESNISFCNANMYVKSSEAQKRHRSPHFHLLDRGAVYVGEEGVCIRVFV